MKRNLILIAGVIVTGCSSSRRPGVPSPIRTSIPLQVSVKKYAVPTVSEITIDREPGLTNRPLPSYMLTLRNDGSATYIGRFYGERNGTNRVSIPKADYSRLAQLVRDCRFESLQSFYGLQLRDVGQVTLSVVIDGTRYTTIYSEILTPFNGSQPDLKREIETQKTLMDLAKQIDKAVVDADWVHISDNSTTPQYHP